MTSIIQIKNRRFCYKIVDKNKELGTTLIKDCICEDYLLWQDYDGHFKENRV